MYSTALCFFFNDTATTEIYTLSLHDALPISTSRCCPGSSRSAGWWCPAPPSAWPGRCAGRGPRSGRCAAARCTGCRSEEHTSELQSRQYLVCRLLLEKKNKTHSPLTRDSIV